MHKLLAVTLAGLLLQASLCWSQSLASLDPVVVSATRIETPLSQTSRSVTVIDARQLEDGQFATVQDALRSVPGLDVVRAGGPGQQTSVFLRGANSEHTLVLVDGIPVNDPASPSRFFNFADLTTDNVERIEIVRGPGSAVHGSDALGGVIHILTRKGQGPPRASLTVEGGAYDTHRHQLSIRGGTSLVNYSLAASYAHSEGFSAARRKDGNRERDGQETVALSTRIGFTPMEPFGIDVILRYTDSDTDLDNSGGPGGDDPNFTLTNRSLFFRAQSRLALFNERWEQTLGFFLADYDRKSRDDTDSLRPFDSSRSRYEGHLQKIDWQHNLLLSETHTLTMGLDYQRETARQKDQRTFEDWLAPGTAASSSTHLEKRSARTLSYYLQDQIRWRDGFFTTLGLRLSDHERFGSRTTWQIASSYRIHASDTLLRGSYGTGFKAPSLLQLYDPDFGGNRELRPEKSRGWDVGLEQPLWSNRLTLGVTYFANDFRDLIVNNFDPVIFEFVYENVGKARTQGVEFVASGYLSANLTVRAGYTYTETENRQTQRSLLRRPRHKFAVDLDYRFLERGNLTLNVTCVGPRSDVFFNNETFASGRTRMPGYALANISGSYRVNQRLRLFGRVENLLDKDYVEVWGYGTPGIAGYAGAEFTF